MRVSRPFTLGLLPVGRQTGHCPHEKGGIGPKHLDRIERGEKVLARSFDDRRAAAANPHPIHSAED